MVGVIIISPMSLEDQRVSWSKKYLWSIDYFNIVMYFDVFPLNSVVSMIPSQQKAKLAYGGWSKR